MTTRTEIVRLEVVNTAMSVKELFEHLEADSFGTPEYKAAEALYHTILVATHLASLLEKEPDR